MNPEALYETALRLEEVMECVRAQVDGLDEAEYRAFLAALIARLEAL